MAGKRSRPAAGTYKHLRVNKSSGGFAMTETAHHEAHHGPKLQSYLVIGIALSIFTVVSFVVNSMVKKDMLETHTGFFIILAVAVVKAFLVGMYFMHLKYDWPKLYFMIIPAFILGAMMGLVLLPDMVLAWPYK
jgi:caa(3)-type oxidase subunit IV